MLIELEDKVVNTDLRAGTILKNLTTLNLDEETNICLVTKTMEFCIAEEFGNELPAKIYAETPISFSRKDREKIQSFCTAIRDNGIYQYKEIDYINKYTVVTINEQEKYLMPVNDRLLSDFSKIYMPTLLNFIRLDKIKTK